MNPLRKLCGRRKRYTSKYICPTGWRVSGRSSLQGGAPRQRKSMREAVHKPGALATSSVPASPRRTARLRASTASTSAASPAHAAGSPRHRDNATSTGRLVPSL